MERPAPMPTKVTESYRHGSLLLDTLHALHVLGDVAGIRRKFLDLLRLALDHHSPCDRPDVSRDNATASWFFAVDQGYRTLWLACLEEVRRERNHHG
jgi:hypothetical protein